MFKRYIVVIILITFVCAAGPKAGTTGTFDIDKFCKAVYDLYQTDEVQAKKELFVYKKINEVIGSTQTMTVTPSDSIGYDRKNDMSYFKSREIYYSDNKQGYFGVFVTNTMKGDGLLMKCTPDKELSISGKVVDIIVLEYIKNNLNQKCFTPLKDFDDKGTVIQKVLFKVES